MFSEINDFIIKNDINSSISCTLRKGELPNRLIIICVGLTDTKDIPVYVKISELLRQSGFSVLSFNYSKEAIGFNVQQQYLDTAQVVKHMVKDYSDISIIGSSLGAISALMCAINLELVKRVAIINGFFGREDVVVHLKKSYKLVKLFSIINRKHAQLVKFVQEATRGSNFLKPILIIYGEDDKIVDPCQSKYFFETAASDEKQIVGFPNMDHVLSRKNNVELVVSKITEWLLSYWSTI